MAGMAISIRSLLRLLNSIEIHKLPNFKPFSTNSTANPHSPHLINELSRILSDYRNPQNDVESALTPFASNLSTDIVEQVLKRCKNLGFAAHRFFLWSERIPGFQHSSQSYRILVEILGSSRQFPYLWDFLLGLKHSKSFEINREVFWIVFRAYSRANLPGDAIRTYNKMGDFGIRPCVDDLDQLLYTLCKRKHVKHAQEFFDQVKGNYLNPTLKTYNILMKGWGEIGESDGARKLFDEMLERGYALDVPSWNSVMDALCKGGKVEEAYELFHLMLRNGLEPDAHSYSIFIHASCESNKLHSAFRVLDSMKRRNLVPNVFTYNCIVKKLCKNDKIDEAYELLEEMIERGARPDTWTYNTILAFHCDNNEVNTALKLILRMDLDSCKPDKHTYNLVLKMLIRVGRFDRVETVWHSMEERGFHPSVSTYSVMVHGLCKKKGKLEEACKYFEMMIDEGIPPYATTCEMLRRKLITLRFVEKVDILADKMEQSTSQVIQEAANLMKGNKRNVRLRTREEFSDESDDSFEPNPV